jgi:hypothetical protein
MGDIFYRADQVLVWLGEEGDTTDVAFKYLRRVALVCKTSISRSLMGPSLVKKLRRFDGEYPMISCLPAGIDDGV